jgi:hypothetical protein
VTRCNEGPVAVCAALQKELRCRAGQTRQLDHVCHASMGPSLQVGDGQERSTQVQCTASADVCQ